MKLEDIFKIKDLKERVKELKRGRVREIQDISIFEKQLNPKRHKIFDKTLRPDKIIRKTDGSTAVEPVARIGLSFQKLIVKRSVAFLFGNPVEYTSPTGNKTQKTILEAIKSIMKDVKINSFNRKIAKDLFSCTEVAELWYPVTLGANESKYGINSNSKFKVKILSPLKGDSLYPYFDEYGDLIAFSREYNVRHGKNNSKKYFEVYTGDFIYKYEITDNGILEEDGFPKSNILGKIPIVYAEKEETDWEDVQDLIERLEKLLSNFADTNDYHGSPKLFIKGKIKGFSSKGESGAILEGEQNTEASYLSWQNAPESVKLEIVTLKEMIHTLSQTPDISFDSIKSIGNNSTSGKALRFMFLDAHLKVMDNMEVFEEYLQRRMSIVKSFISQANTSLRSEVELIDIESEVIPFMVDDYLDKLEYIMTATGNKAVLSQKTGIKLAGLTDDAEREYKNIQSEETFDILEPTE